jgi:hypothetical protein
LLGLRDPGCELVVEEREEEPVLGAEVVVQRSFRAACVLAHTIQRSRVVAVARECPPR